jgi:molybdopterin molybdotransferase
MQFPVPVDEAVRRIVERVEPLAARPFSVAESLGLVLSEPLLAGEDHPPFDNSAMDGFAVRSGDVPGTLEIVEEIDAGSVPTRSLSAGQTARIMTGAPMPAGADAVVMVEYSTRKEPHLVELSRGARAGENVRRRGEHLRAGQVALAPGQPLTPAGVALAAYLGYPQVSCNPRPRVAVVSTGDELTEPQGDRWPIGPSQIRNSNAYGLEAKLKQLGCPTTRLPAVADDPKVIAAVLREQLETHDALVTSAGVSMGEKDYVLRVLRELGAELVFWKVAMRPGRPLGFGTWKGKPIFALPGNPVSSLVTFEIFCRPALLKMMGRQAAAPQLTPARLGESLSKPAELRLYYRCRVHREDDQLWAVSTGRQDSHLLNSLVEADALMILPEGLTQLEKGDEVQLLFPDRPL